jgi:hypothetical protein
MFTYRKIYYICYLKKGMAGTHDHSLQGTTQSLTIVLYN